MKLDCNEIIPGRLWVGGYISPAQVPLLAGMRITAVVNLQTDEDLAAYGVALNDLLEAYMESGIQLRRVPTRDFDRQSLAANLRLCVAELAGALEPASARVYLHCTAGINRSTTTAAGYLIRSHGMSARHAYDYVAARRHCSPDLAVLEQFEKSPARAAGPLIRGVETV